MRTTFPSENAGQAAPADELIVKYEGENDQAFLVSDRQRRRMSVPKNRNAARPQSDPSALPLKWVYRLLVLAFIGLAPAGLGTLVLASLAALWALVLVLSRPLSREDTIRVAVVWVIAAGLLAIAVPLSRLFLVHLAKVGLA
jgi:hypothetical protein